MTIPNELGFEQNIGEESYLPFALALEQGKIDTSRVKVHKPSDAAIMVANGTMPDQGGIIDLPDGLGAIDLVGAKLHGDTISIVPTTKKAVNAETDKIEGEGFGVLTFPGGDRLRIFAYAVEARRSFFHRNFGKSALVNSLGFDALDLELKEVNSKSGSLLTKSRRKLF